VYKSYSFRGQKIQKLARNTFDLKNVRQIRYAKNQRHSVQNLKNFVTEPVIRIDGTVFSRKLGKVKSL